jgi:redox-sensitive bicupin YhaK (pirin superfamily)
MTEAASSDHAVELTIEPRLRPVGDSTVRRLLPFHRRRMVGPFIYCDLIGPEELAPGVGLNVDAHPHIGLSTITYLVVGRIVHRDSTGAVQTIEAGAVNWMTAGSGVTHTERSHPDDIGSTAELFGLQTWVALPDEVEDRPPGFEHCGREDVPTEQRPGIELRLAAGTGFGLTAPVTGSSPLALVDVQLTDGTLAIAPDHPERAVLALTGGLSLASGRLPAGHLAVLERGATPDLHGRGRAMILAGEPVGRRHIWWNFVHSDPDRIEQAKQQWIDQTFPKVPLDHDPYVPLPDR